MLHPRLAVLALALTMIGVVYAQDKKPDDSLLRWLQQSEHVSQSCDPEGAGEHRADVRQAERVVDRVTRHAPGCSPVGARRSSRHQRHHVG